ncbi:tetratricopeptide repeat protein [Phragmitibacter flavus]|uniref:Tetratricopeptide repeat protein n=1 Tax=Phragmitibacter flavus TaxID=2576071 RepID=A0A5R8KHQ4_9BACT|nr:tetratricopeptide repeat protein [Phragmitibacter flavus]TLD71812.1 tetratricopeptide repeat protein [Phragmitibacter flavus]
MTTRFRRFLALALALTGALWSPSPLPAQTTTSWTDKETRLATEYLGLLVEKPDDTRVLDLLWSLYDKHQQTPFLLESIAAQAAQQPHPNVILIHAQLLQKAGRLDEALARYQELLKQQPEHPAALTAVSELMQQNGDPATALTYLQKLTATVPSTDPRHAQLLLQQATQLLALNRPDDAAKACEQALALRPADTTLLREASRLLLGAGMIDNTLAIMQRLVEAAPDPTVKLDALFDLSRLHEQAGQFKPAAAALQQGLDLLHDKDWRYGQFFQRLVKLHERFDQLDALKQQLLRDAAQKPVTEKALNNLARYASQVVDGEERIKWLRELVTQFPDNLAHRWELVTALIDHNEAAEAAALIDPYLKRDGSDRAQLILLRAQTHLLLTETDKSIALLQQLLQQQSADPEVEKLVLTFARQKSLDPLIESILEKRIDRTPGKPESLFELATFQRTRGNHKAVEQLFERYIQTSPPEEKQRRLNDVASFLSSSPDLQAAENAARSALATPEAGQPELLRLADVLAQRNATDEAHSLLERAWTLSTTDEQRADVDERLASVLSGEQGAKLLTNPVEPPTEFTLPAMFSGEGFGSEAPPEKPPTVPETLTDYAQNLATSALHQIYRPLLRLALTAAPSPFDSWLRDGLTTPSSPPPDPQRIQRAAWWSLRTGQPGTATLLLQHLTHGPAGQRLDPTLEVEKLYLEVLLLNADKQPEPAIAQLRRLAQLDPASRTACHLRLAELEARRNGQQGLLTAVTILEDLINTDPANDTILSALAQFYLESGQRDKALALWENAARNAVGKTSPILERYGELLIAQRRHDEYLQTQIRLIEQEPDIKRRRDFFQRAIERLLWADAVQGELPEDERIARLSKIKMLLLDRARRDPFEAFWNEALAHIYQREGDDTKAFAAMKQAYYTAPDTPFSLDQLRLAALRVGDIKSAIYFQKQIAALAAAPDQATEWRQLVQLLESDFRMGEADLARRRLEARFSQDPTALEELALYYTETAQDDAARRVLEQLVRIRSWDATHLLRLALQQKKLGDHPAARNTLIRLLATIPATVNPDLANTPERWPWPIFDEKFPSPTSPSLLINSLESAPGLEPAERDRLRLFLSLPRPEFVELPDDPAPVRLRAIQELVTLPNPPALALPDGLSEIESAWFHYFSQNRDALREQITRLLYLRKNLESRFLLVWLALKSHNPSLIVDWIINAPDNDRTARKNLAYAALTVICDEHTFHLTPQDARTLGSSRIFSNTEIIELAKKLENRHDHDLALDLAEAMREISAPLSVEHLLELARIAESSRQGNRQRPYYLEIWSRPLHPAVGDHHQGFIQSFSRLWGLSTDPHEREHLLSESLRRLNQLPPSTADDLRKARLLGIAGITEPSARQLSRIAAVQLPAARAFAEPLIGRLPPGVNPGPRIDSLTHMRDYWTDLRQYAEIFRYDGLSPILDQLNDATNRRNAGVALGSRATFEFNAWRNSVLLRQLRFADYPERLRLVRNVLQSDDSVDFMLDLGNFLENQGYSREAIEVYQRLIPRSPANDEYSQQFRRACENSGESAVAIEYIEKTLPAQVHFKPQGIDETLREEHSRHLARLHDLARLRQLAYLPDTSTKSSPGRVPEPVPYLKELALMLEARNDHPGALAAWEEMHRLWPRDLEASLHRARLLRRQGNRNRALAALREIPLINFWNDPVREAFEMRAELVAETGLWDEMRQLMNVVSGTPGSRVTTASSNANSLSISNPGAPGSSGPTYTGGVLILSRVLAEHQRLTEAQSLLLRAERAVRDNTERFKLRLEQLRLAAINPSWSPATDQPRIAAWLRAFTDDRDALTAMTTFLQRESTGPRAQAWLKVLRQPNLPRHPVTSLALATFAPLLTDSDLTNLSRPWENPATPVENARELTVTTLLNHQKPQWALQTALTGEDGGLRNSPAILPVHHALGDRHSIDELFARLVRTTFPGSSNTAPYAEAFAQIGRNDLAEELYDFSLQRLRNTASSHPPLIESHARFLLRQHRYEAAENLLLKEHHGMTEGLAPLLVELYRGWNKLDQLPTQLAKYHLPDSVLQEALFLASQPPAPAPAPPS